MKHPLPAKLGSRSKHFDLGYVLLVGDRDCLRCGGAFEANCRARDFGGYEWFAHHCSDCKKVIKKIENGKKVEW